MRHEIRTTENLAAANWANRLAAMEAAADRRAVTAEVPCDRCNAVTCTACEWRKEKMTAK